MEICLVHLNEALQETLTEKDVSLKMDMCKFCGERKPCVMSIKRRFYIKSYFQYWLKKIR